MTKRKNDWTADMGRRSTLEGEQVYCLTADEGHRWIHVYDQFPSAVRKHMASSTFNLCPACVEIMAKAQTRRPSVDTYFAVIAEIEKKIRS